MNIFSRGVRNAFRNAIRAGAIIGMLGLSIGLSLAMLLANKAVGQKIENIQANVGNTITVTPAGIRGFMGGGDPLNLGDITAIKKLSHVTSVDQSLSDRLSSDGTNLESAIEAGSFGKRQIQIERNQSSAVESNSSASNQDFNTPSMGEMKPSIMVVGSTNPLGGATTITGGEAELTSGKAFDGTKDEAVALVGKDLASKNNLKVGSKFTAYSTEFTVAGIYDTGDTFSNNQVIMALPTVQRLSEQEGAVTSATVHIDSAVNLESTTKAISSKLGDDASVTNDAERTKSTLGSLENIQNVSFFSLIGASVTASAILLLTMVMIVRERRREIGVLKAIGGSNLRVMGQFAIESLTLTSASALIGIIIGSIAATPVTKLLANNSSTSTSQTMQMGQGGPGNGNAGGFRARIENNSVAQGVKNLQANVDASVLVYGLGGALLIAAIGSTAAAGLIAKVRPAEVMRAE